MFSNSFSFEGRIRRSEYGISFIIYIISTSIVDIILEENEYSGDMAWLVLSYIPLTWFFWAQGAKRCHDLGKSGWWQIIPFYILWLIFADGQKGHNIYGDNPKGHNGLYQINPSLQTSPNTSQGYQGGYSGGHNNYSTPVSGTSYTTQNTTPSEYQSGELYK